MSNKDTLFNMIENLNEDGINLILCLFKDIDKNEKYNISTTPARLEELRQIEKQENERIKVEREKSALEAARARYRKQEEFKAALTGKAKQFIELIDSVKPDVRYCISVNEIILLSDLYNNSLLNGCYDVFRYGFLKGQRAERARRKKVLHGK